MVEVDEIKQLDFFGERAKAWPVLYTEVRGLQLLRSYFNN